MSPHAVNSLVTDLVQMAQAMEKVPQLEAELANANHAIALLEADKQSLWDDLEQSKQYNATLEQKVHDLEVAKDVAETMFLEADERTSRALDFIKTSFGSAGALIQSLEPVRVEVTSAAPSSAYASDGTISPGESASPLPTSSEPIQSIETTGSIDYAQGQSEPGPTAAHSTESLSTSAHSTAESMPSVDTEGTEYHHAEPSWATPSPQPDTKPQPYAGKTYSQAYKDPNWSWPSYEKWIDNGGTQENWSR
jgi:hypothetical protein